MSSGAVWTLGLSLTPGYQGDLATEQSLMEDYLIVIARSINGDKPLSLKVTKANRGYHRQYETGQLCC